MQVAFTGVCLGDVSVLGSAVWFWCSDICAGAFGVHCSRDTAPAAATVAALQQQQKQQQ